MLEQKTEELMETVKEIWSTSMGQLIGESFSNESLDEESMKMFLQLNKCMNTAFELSLEQAKTLDQMNQKLDKLLNKVNTTEES